MIQNIGDRHKWTYLSSLHNASWDSGRKELGKKYFFCLYSVQIRVSRKEGHGRTKQLPEDAELCCSGRNRLHRQSEQDSRQLILLRWWKWTLLVKSICCRLRERCSIILKHMLYLQISGLPVPNTPCALCVHLMLHNGTLRLTTIRQRLV